jgi:hypothetical protein
MPDTAALPSPGREARVPAGPALQVPAAAASARVVPGHAQEAAAGEALTRRAITAITGAIVVMTFAFSLGNVTQLCRHLGITVWIAWQVGPAVDLSVIGLLTGIQYLSLHGYTPAELVGLRRMLLFCGLLTLALNTAGSIAGRQYGTALVDAVGPALLMGWSEVGPWLLRQIHAVRPATASTDEQREDSRNRQPRQASPASVQSAVLSPALLARARKLDSEHRAALGRPISRDNLRAQLRIGRDRASALIAVVRAEIPAGERTALAQGA